MSSELSEVLWSVYLAVVLEVDIGHNHIHVLFSPTSGYNPLVGGNGQALHGFVVTAWNPRSVVVPPERNVALNHRLVERLDELAVSWMPAVGRSEDNSYREEGYFLSGLSQEEVADLAREFDQHGFYAASEREILCVLSSSGEARALTVRTLREL